jgi:hypothetical protein
MPFTISGKTLVTSLIMIIISLGAGSFIGFNYSQLQTRLEYQRTLDNYTAEIKNLDNRITVLTNTNNAT